MAPGTCPNDKGLATATYSVDFTSVKTLPSEWTLADSEHVTLGPQGAELAFEKRYDAPTMWTDFKFFFGRVEFVVKAAPGTGIVSSMVLLSDDLDEVDWEFLGGVTSTVQTNYFGKGYTGTYNRSTTPAVTSPQTTFHTYALDWSTTALVWSIDGVAVRTLNAADADGNGSQYPQSPMKVSLGLWDAGDPDAATQGWGGGVTPIPPPEPYIMYVKSVKIWNTNPAQQYQYTDQSGSYQSIKLINDPVVSSSSPQISSQSAETLSLGSTSASPSPVVTTSSSTDGIYSSSSESTIAEDAPSSSSTVSNTWNNPVPDTASSNYTQWSTSASGSPTSELLSPTWASVSGQSSSTAQLLTSTVDSTVTRTATDCSCTSNGTSTTTASSTAWVVPTYTGAWNASSDTTTSISAPSWSIAAVSSLAASSVISYPSYGSAGSLWQTSWGSSTSVSAPWSSGTTATSPQTLALASSTSNWSNGAASSGTVNATSSHECAPSTSYTTSWATSTFTFIPTLSSSATSAATTWSVPFFTPGKSFTVSETLLPYSSASADTAIHASTGSSSFYSPWLSSAQPAAQTQEIHVVSSGPASANTWTSDYGSASASASGNQDITTTSHITSTLSYTFTATQEVVESSTSSSSSPSAISSNSAAAASSNAAISLSSSSTAIIYVSITNTATQGAGSYPTSTGSNDTEDEDQTQGAPSSSNSGPGSDDSTASFSPSAPAAWTTQQSPSYLAPWPLSNASAPTMNPPLVSGSGPWVNGTIPFHGAASKADAGLEILITAIASALILFW
ncbi:MAG: hypothetical protein LQ352_007899 [Teloschistes flavicans]|nr:MAG: hypothetical protein LQ352_007899 [Teloschistes flavicans]